jgi:hypothetical protein
MITSLDRDLPLIVFTPLALPTAEQDGLHPSDVEHAMRQTAVGLAGTASVCCIDDGPTIDELREILGAPYAVWGGAARIYMPGADPAVDDGWRHRYFPPERYLRTGRRGCCASTERSASTSSWWRSRTGSSPTTSTRRTSCWGSCS